MKKVKLMLVGAALVTTVGAAFAFKAHKGGNLFCATSHGAACNIDPQSQQPIVYSQNDDGTALFCSSSSTNCASINTTTKVVVDPK